MHILLEDTEDTHVPMEAVEDAYTLAGAQQDGSVAQCQVLGSDKLLSVGCCSNGGAVGCNV